MLNKNKLLLLSLFFTCSSFAVTNVKIIEPATENPYDDVRIRNEINELNKTIQRQNAELQSKEDNEKQEQEINNGLQTGTASEQGYVDPSISAKQLEQIKKYERLNSARQLGYTIQVPKPLNTVENNSKTLKNWYLNWKGLLVERVGITSEKVDFEASRLSKEEFERWATDFLYYHYDGFKNQERTIYNYTE